MPNEDPNVKHMLMFLWLCFQNNKKFVLA